jgi:hypothetical protein
MIRQCYSFFDQYAFPFEFIRAIVGAKYYYNLADYNSILRMEISMLKEFPRISRSSFANQTYLITYP